MSTQDDKPLSSLLRRLLRNPSVDWFLFALDIAQSLRRLLCSQPTGPYEILDYEATVELLDTAGKVARFRKRQRVKFLQDHVIGIEDYVWGDGDVLHDYRCSPGIVVDRYKEGDRWNILVSLRATKSIGDVEQFHIARTVKNGYLSKDEWLQTEIRRHTRRLEMNVIFPRGRHCLRAVLVRRSANKTVELGPDHFDSLPDGRQLLTWETDHARAYEVYTLKWRW